ncbi:MAG TPA: ribosome-associated translation inhibitor RaiA [Burkholderiales bacterium]|nr:ribosome-associated translation inhibitor RaiA [Burkholderiales bacterium]
MQLPVQITYHGMESSAALDNAVREKVAKLEQYHPRITSCRVVIEQPAQRKRKGRQFVVRVDLTAPGNEIALNHDHAEDVYVALRDAFDAARRRLEVRARTRRAELKRHER